METQNEIKTELSPHALMAMAKEAARLAAASIIGDPAQPQVAYVAKQTAEGGGFSSFS